MRERMFPHSFLSAEMAGFDVIEAMLFQLHNTDDPARYNS